MVVTACIGEAHAAGELVVASGLGVGGFGEFFGGFVEMSAEIADRSCAGVGPHAAAEGDVFEDIDALVCESGLAG